METARKQARNLKRGERIVFDFRGSKNHLGDVEVFDAYPASTSAAISAGRGVTQLVLTDSKGRHHYRRVADTTTFTVR
jgi:hypothetical protein